MIDKVISAEIPSSSLYPELHAIVKVHMVHGPCHALNRTSPCMKDENTQKISKGICYVYRPGSRRLSQVLKEITCRWRTHCKDQDAQGIDNQWIVPYNPWLLRQMNCHVNIKLCMSIKSIKYVFKYVNKGCDQAVYTIQATVQQQNTDEIRKFQQAHFVGSCKAAWLILDFT